MSEIIALVKLFLIASSIKNAAHVADLVLAPARSPGRPPSQSAPQAQRPGPVSGGAGTSSSASSAIATSPAAPIRFCVVCGRRFTSRYAGRVTCSPACQAILTDRLRKTREDLSGSTSSTPTRTSTNGR